MIEIMSEQEGIDILKAEMPKGVEISVSAIQRHLRWGFNRSYRTLLLALETGQAEYCENEMAMKFR